MATIRKKRKEPVSVFQRDPGPWSRLLINWLATLAVLVTALGVFGWATDGFSAFTAEAALMD